ncbi:hypothetical protein XCR1_860003 [Xenorhabdus cabanillasii JM26]|uniref:Uncharacterized protein n=1 Tax=Xenorhabdus cabanillasii JM26 TaxID=1427517 RepID=W1J914_9GAMM|nr:hypothetical protein XCR1_860003 [Xenorhabdus cabanillasii JM26]
MEEMLSQKSGVHMLCKKTDCIKYRRFTCIIDDIIKWYQVVTYHDHHLLLS